MLNGRQFVVILKQEKKIIINPTQISFVLNSLSFPIQTITFDKIDSRLYYL